MSPPPPCLSGRYVMSSGRTIGFAEYGDPSGASVLHVHGFPSSRLEFAPNHAAAFAAGIRVISPDRPGVGLSDAVADVSPPHWATDITQLVDGLGVGRFAILSWSGGGPYAAACAAACHDRVVAFAAVAGIPPRTSDVPQRPRERLARWRDTAILWEFRRIARRRPERFVTLIERTLAPCDRVIMARPEIHGNEVRNVTEAFRQSSRAMLGEVSARIRGGVPALLPTRVPAALWIGARDRNIPISTMHKWSIFMPHARAIVHPDSGHLLFYSDSPSILGWLALNS